MSFWVFCWIINSKKESVHKSHVFWIGTPHKSRSVFLLNDTAVQETLLWSAIHFGKSSVKYKNNSFPPNLHFSFVRHGVNAPPVSGFCATHLLFLLRPFPLTIWRLFCLKEISDGHVTCQNAVIQINLESAIIKHRCKWSRFRWWRNIVG